MNSDHIKAHKVYNYRMNPTNQKHQHVINMSPPVENTVPTSSSSSAPCNSGRGDGLKDKKEDRWNHLADDLFFLATFVALGFGLGRLLGFIIATLA